MQFVEFIHKYDIHQAKKRAEAMKAVRSHLTRRFMRFFRIFRHKKYGEALEDYANNDKPTPNFIPFDFENVEYPPEIQKQDNILKEQFRALEHQYNMSNGEASQAKNTDLEEIIEEDHSPDDTEIASKKDYLDHISLVLTECVVI